MDQFLICHRGALGDFVLTWPTLYALRKSLPDLRFMGVGRTEYMRLAVRLGLLDSCCSGESSEMVGFFAGRSIPPVLGSPKGAILWLSEGRAVADLLKRSGASLPVALIPPFPQKRMHVSTYHYLSIQSHFQSHFPSCFRFPMEIPDPRSSCFSLGVRRGEYALIHPGSGSSAKNYHPQFYLDLAAELRHWGIPEVRFVLGPVEAQDRRMAHYLSGSMSGSMSRDPSGSMSGSMSRDPSGGKPGSMSRDLSGSEPRDPSGSEFGERINLREIDSQGNNPPGIDLPGINPRGIDSPGINPLGINLREIDPQGNNPPGIDLPEDVEALARLQAGASLYIGNDSGASHLAGVLGTPTIALYKVTDPEVWGVMGRRVTNLKAENEDSALQQIREYLEETGIPIGNTTGNTNWEHHW